MVKLERWEAAQASASSPDDWYRVDQLAVELFRNSKIPRFGVKDAVRLAFRRLHGNVEAPVERCDPTDCWNLHLLQGIWNGLNEPRLGWSQDEANSQTCQNPLWGFDAPVCAVTRNFEISSASRPWCHWIGYDPRDVIGEISLNFLTDKSRRKAESRHVRASECCGVTNDISYDLIHKDGSIVPVMVSSVRTPIDGEKDNWRAFVTFRPRADFS